MIHPHQAWNNKVGGEVFVQNNSIQKWSDKGFVTVAVSQPGYGKSDGWPDFCGPRSQQAVIDVINHFKNLVFVDTESIFIYGGSRGAVIASMIATKYPGLKGVILKSGLYDLVEANNLYEWYNPIKLTMLWEMGWLSEKKLKERSALYFANLIKTPLLVIHGSQDDRASIANAIAFVDKIKASHGNIELIELKSEHIIPMSTIEPYMESFFSKMKVKK